MIPNMKKNISEVDRLVLLNKEIRVGKFAFYDDNQSSHLSRAINANHRQYNVLLLTCIRCYLQISHVQMIKFNGSDRELLLSTKP